MYILIWPVGMCQRVLYFVSICTVLTPGRAAGVEVSDESTACTENAMSGAADLLSLYAIDALIASLATLIAVRPSTPIASTRSRTMARPKPKPPDERAREASVR